MKNRIGYVLTLLLGIVALPVFLKSCLNDSVVRTNLPVRSDYAFNKKLSTDRVSLSEHTGSMNASDFDKFTQESPEFYTRLSNANIFLRTRTVRHK